MTLLSQYHNAQFAHDISKWSRRSTLKSDRNVQLYDYFFCVDYLTEALTATSSTAALESLNLQKDRHLRQIEIIRDRKSKQHVEAKCDKPHTDSKETTVNEKPTNGVAEKTPAIMSERLYTTMEQCDTLLCYLEGRTEARFRKNHKPLYQLGVKIQKDEQQIIEELRVHNESLQNHILSLLKEREQFKIEVDRLRSENERLCRDRARLDSRWVTSSSHPLYLNEPGLQLGSLELPPLEMPKFDFDVLSGTHDRDSLN